VREIFYSFESFFANQERSLREPKKSNTPINTGNFLNLNCLIKKINMGADVSHLFVASARIDDLNAPHPEGAWDVNRALLPAELSAQA